MDQFAYNKYTQLSEFSYSCITHMLENNELIWKLLKYTDPDAWNKPNLTREEKAALIYSGVEDGTNFRVFMDTGQPDVWTHEDCIVRISPYSIFPENRTIGTVTIMFEVYSHYKINHLSNYKTRVDVIAQQFLELFNGAYIGGIGNLFFDKLGNEENRLFVGGQIPFKGKWILMSTKSA